MKVYVGLLSTDKGHQMTWRDKLMDHFETSRCCILSSNIGKFEDSVPDMRHRNDVEYPTSLERVW